MYTDEDITCPACGAPQAFGEALLGQLGRLVHFRCRHCHASFSMNESDLIGSDDYEELNFED